MYFNNCKTVSDIRNRYFALAKQYHPDVSGQDTTAEMQAVNAAYLEALRSLDGAKYGNAEKSYTYRYHQKREEEAMRIIYALLTFLPAQAKVELVGYWVWVSRVQKEDADTHTKLKALKMRWHGKRHKWYWRPKGYRARYAQGVSFDEIRATYGGREFSPQDTNKAVVPA
jgi:curved DNA-binding protein CbpA